MATAFKVVRGGAPAEPVERRLAFVKDTTGRVANPDVLARFEGLGPEGFRRAVVLIDLLVNRIRPRVHELRKQREIERWSRCKDHTWVMEQLRSEIPLEQKLTIIAYAIHFERKARVTVASEDNVIHLGDDAAIGEYNYMIKANFNGREVVIQINTKESVDATQLLFVVGNLFVQAGGKKVEMIQASGYDPDTGLLTRQMFDSIIQARTKTTDGMCYCLSIKFGDEHYGEVEILLRNMMRLLKHEVHSSTPIAYYYFSEIRLAIFEDSDRMRLLFYRLSDAITKMASVDKMGHQVIPKSTKVTASVAIVDSVGELTYQELAL